MPGVRIETLTAALLPAISGDPHVQPAMGPELRTRDDVLRLLIGLDRVADDASAIGLRQQNCPRTPPRCGDAGMGV